MTDDTTALSVTANATEALYYVQLLFLSGKERDNAYGNEFRYTPELTGFNDISLAARWQYEVLMRAKGKAETGKRRLFGHERLPTIELVIAVQNGEGLEAFLTTAPFRIGERRFVNKASLTFRYGGMYSTRDNVVDDVTRVSEELGLSSQKIHTMQGGFFETSYAEGMFLGTVRQVLGMYEYLQRNQIPATISFF